MGHEEWLEFHARDESGKSYLLRARRPLLDASSLSHADAVSALVDRLETGDGMSVRRIDKGVYQIETTGVIVHSDDPAAL